MPSGIPPKPRQSGFGSQALFRFGAVLNAVPGVMLGAVVADLAGGVLERFLMIARMMARNFSFLMPMSLSLFGAFD